jgi:hypothetical protein
MLKRFPRATQAFKNISFIMGFRPDYKLENLFISIAFFIISLMYFTLGSTLITILIGSILLLTPLFLQYNVYRKGFRRNIQLPLYVVLMSAFSAMLVPPLVLPAIINGMFIEDFTVFFEFDVTRTKRTIRVLLAPITRRELFALIAGTTLSSFIAYIMTKSLLVFIYPVIAYSMIAYSLVLVPPQYRPPERSKNLLEEVSRRVAILYFIFNKIYMNPKMRTLGKEAGLFGHNYDVFIKRMGGLFTLSIYFGLAVSPLLNVIIGNLGYLVPLLLAGIFLVLPYFSLSSKKRSRAGKIARNQLLILSYLASMKAVSESFTNLMFNLRDNLNLAKLFGMEEEAKLYHQIYMAKGIESVAVREYADSIPDDFYRDTVRTMQDIEENEGVGATFRMLVGRLRDYTGRYIDRVSTLFENIGGNVISVIMLIETALPILMFLSNPTMLPLLMLAGGVLSAIMMYGIASGVLPDLPSEYIYTKPRYRRAALVFTLVSLLLILIEKALTPNILFYELILNIPVALWVAWWYASAEDLSLNNMLLDKFSDLLVLFSSAISRYNSVERAMLELAQQPTFPKRLREEFIKLARVFMYVNVQKLQYRGPYWYKYLMFLASISAIYGISPRELYKTIGNFMLEFKRFFGLVKSFGKSMLFMAVIALLIMTMEMDISFQFLKITQTINIQQASQSLGIQSPFPSLRPEEIARLTTLGQVSLLVVAMLNGIGLAKIISGTVRDGRYVIMLYLLELLLIYVGATTNFGINLAVKP